MSAAPAPLARAAGSARGPALCLLAVTLGVVLVRPPLPLDETRYLAVFRETLGSNPFLLRLLGLPYAEKPPLLFWLGRLLAQLPIAPETAQRLVPSLVGFLSVVFVTRLGRRAGLALAGWAQAALLLAFLPVQYVLFDPLLACCVWGAVDAWVARRDKLAWIGASAALLAKGPVALLFLATFFWTTLPLRGTREGNGKRALAILAPALLPLAAWAIGAAILGGPEFARALLWDRWAGRVVSSFAHQRALWFYVPVLLFGALPGTLVWLAPRQKGAPEWERRTELAVVALFVVFTLISGKQAHYLVPLGPALALLVAARVERSDAALRWLRVGVRAELGLVTLAVLAAPFLRKALAHSAGTDGREFLAGPGLWLALGFSLACALAALVFVLRPRPARALLAASVLGVGGAMLGAHAIAGEILYPHALERALRAYPERDLGFLGRAHYGVYEILAAPRRPERLRPELLEGWRRAHPTGLVLAEEEVLAGTIPDGLEPIAADTIHRIDVLLLRPKAPGGS